jgi:diguanylate cyclase (GGDEF)-like protein
LQAATRSADLVARYAGDEFVVLLDAVESPDTARQVRGTIEQLLREPLKDLGAAHGRNVVASGSVGLALFEGSDFTAEDLIRRADTDMYERKAASSKLVAGA